MLVNLIPYLIDFSDSEINCLLTIEQIALELQRFGVCVTRTIQVDQSRQLSTSDLGKDIFDRANPGSQVFVASAANSNTGTAEFGSASVTPGSANAGMKFSVQFETDAATGAVGYPQSRHRAHD